MYLIYPVWHSLLFLFWLLASSFVADAGAAFDGSMGRQGTLAGNFTVPATAGQVVGNNVYHSFTNFDVFAGESATFTGAVTTQNVVARVSGGLASTINGLVDTATAMPLANFYLLNPAGILVGNGATFNIAGGAHLSTADYLRMTDNTRFFATPVAGEVLSLAAPSAFGFVGANNGSIAISGVTLNTGGTDLSLTASAVMIGASTINTAGGNIDVTTLAGAGEVTQTAGGLVASSTSGSLGLQASTLNSSGAAAGRIVIRGGQLLLDTATINASSRSGNGGGIVVQATDAILMGSNIISVNSGLGTGGDIALNINAIFSMVNSNIRSSAIGTGLAGNINIAANQAYLDGSNIGSDNLSNFAYGGAAGNIDLLFIDAGNLWNNSSISTNTLHGRGGDITLFATNTLQMDQSNITTQTTFDLGLGSNINMDVLFVIMNSSIINARYANASTTALTLGSSIDLMADYLIRSENSSIFSSSFLNISSVFNTSGNTISIVETVSNNVDTLSESSSAPAPLVFIHRQRPMRWGLRPCWQQGDLAAETLVVSRVDAATTLDGWAASPLPQFETPIKTTTTLHMQPAPWAVAQSIDWMRCVL